MYSLGREGGGAIDADCVSELEDTDVVRGAPGGEDKDCERREGIGSFLGGMGRPSTVANRVTEGQKRRSRRVVERSSWELGSPKTRLSGSRCDRRTFVLCPVSLSTQSKTLWREAEASKSRRMDEFDPKRTRTAAVVEAAGVTVGEVVVVEEDDDGNAEVVAFGCAVVEFEEVY